MSKCWTIFLPVSSPKQKQQRALWGTKNKIKSYPPTALDKSILSVILLRSYQYNLTQTSVSLVSFFSSPVNLFDQSAYFITAHLVRSACLCITSVSGSLFRHTLSAAELRLVVDVKLDKGWREKQSKGYEDRWRGRKAVIKSLCIFPIISSFRLLCSLTPFS